MADIHDHKVGNKGDVWKHFILSSVTHQLLFRRVEGGPSVSAPFVYVDSHCSLGRFSLPEKGQWQEGIGLFYFRKWRLANHPYFVIEQTAFTACRSYLGSWSIVQSLLQSNNVEGDLRLFDTSNSVSQQLAGVRGYCQSDGFEAVLSTQSANLFLIDPAYSGHRESDWRNVRKVGTKFLQQDATAIIWYPIFIKERPLDHLHGAVLAELRWPATGANQVMRGCGVIAFGEASAILHGIQKDLAEIAMAFGGTSCVRDIAR